MKKTLKIIVFLAVLAFASCSGNGISQFRAYIDPETITMSPGSVSTIPVKIEIPGDSHIYGNPKGPGTGKPTTVTATGPAQVSFGNAIYPPAERYTYPGDSDHVFVYSGKIDILLPISVKRDAKPGEYAISVELDALLCTDTTCIPKKITLPCTVKISVASAQTGITGDLPQSSVVQKVQSNDEAIASDTAKTQDDYFRGMTFSPRCIRERSVTGILQAVLFGLLAGFILNFMPCVLPVVSLKIMGFVKHAGSDRRQMILLGSLFSAGILASFAVLALLAAYFGYSWGELFQNSMFLLAMAGIVFALALSMFGVYTINIPSFAGKAARERDNRYADAFVKGLLATLLATPCSGPFLGGTLAWALMQQPHVIFIIFMSVGVGMALPYMLLSVFPGLMRFIPRAGTWTETFEHAMAFLLVFTVVYLLSLMGTDSLMPAVTFLAFVALGLWQYGRYGSPVQKLPARIVSFIVLVTIMAAGYTLSFHYLYTKNTAELRASAFSQERIIANRDRGIISMVQFTAEWCPNCRLVEARSLRTEKVARAIGENRIDYMVADITRDNPAAERLLGLLGSRSIPVLAVIPPGENFYRPLCLRDIYSERDVLDAIRAAAAGNERR